MQTRVHTYNHMYINTCADTHPYLFECLVVLNRPHVQADLNPCAQIAIAQGSSASALFGLDPPIVLEAVLEANGRLFSSVLGFHPLGATPRLVVTTKNVSRYCQMLPRELSQNHW